MPRFSFGGFMKVKLNGGRKPLSGHLDAARAASADPGFSRIPPPDLAVILQLANRASAIAQQHRLTVDKRDGVLEINTELTAIDFAVCHLHRRLKLRDLLECDDLAFMAEYSTIQKFIVRASNFFPGHVALRFASIGASSAN